MQATEQEFYFVNVSENPCAVFPMISIINLSTEMASCLLLANKCDFSVEHGNFVKSIHSDDKRSFRCLFLGRLFSETPEGAGPCFMSLSRLPEDAQVFAFCKENNYDSVWSFEFRINLLRAAQFCGDKILSTETHDYCVATSPEGTQFKYALPDAPNEMYQEYLLKAARGLYDKHERKQKQVPSDNLKKFLDKLKTSGILDADFIERFTENQFDPKACPPPLEDNDNIQVLGASDFNGTKMYIAKTKGPLNSLFPDLPPPLEPWSIGDLRDKQTAIEARQIPSIVGFPNKKAAYPNTEEEKL